MPLARHDGCLSVLVNDRGVSTHMPLARHDLGGLGRFGCGRVFLLTCLLRGMTSRTEIHSAEIAVSTHMPLARHDKMMGDYSRYTTVSTHMPLARHDFLFFHTFLNLRVSTHMPLARHDPTRYRYRQYTLSFYSHASCEA